MAVYYGTSDNGHIDALCTAWRKGLRRCLDLPCDSHSFCLPPLSNTLPLFHEMCKRCFRFITKCKFISSELVQMVVHHSIHQMGFISTINKNMRCVCNLFRWFIEEFVSGSVSVYDEEFMHLQFTQRLTLTQRV